MTRAGRKRHVVTDVLGLILLVTVTAANVHDAVAADPTLGKLNRHHRGIELVHADLGYRGQLVKMVDRDVERTTDSSKTMIKISQISLMLNRLALKKSASPFRYAKREK